MRLGRAHVTVVTPADATTSWGQHWSSLDEADGATRRQVRSCNVQPKNVDVTLVGITAEIVGAEIYAPAGSAIDDGLGLEIDGLAYAVNGPPLLWRSRSGRGKFLRFDVVPWDRLAAFWRHAVVVERFTGNEASGPMLEAPVTITGFVVRGNKTVRSGSGEEASATTTICFPLLTAPIPVGSYLTPPSGQRAKVLTSDTLTDHLEVTLAMSLAELRARAEADLVDRCTIERPTTAWDPGTKKSRTMWELVHAAVPCTFDEAPVTARELLTDEAVTPSNPVVTIPASLTGIEPNDRVTVAGVGIVWVTHAPTGTEQVLRPLQCRWAK